MFRGSGLGYTGSQGCLMLVFIEFAGFYILSRYCPYTNIAQAPLAGLHRQRRVVEPLLEATAAPVAKPPSPSTEEFNLQGGKSNGGVAVTVALGRRWQTRNYSHRGSVLLQHFREESNTGNMGIRAVVVFNSSRDCTTLHV